MLQPPFSSEYESNEEEEEKIQYQGERKNRNNETEEDEEEKMQYQGERKKINNETEEEEEEKMQYQGERKKINNETEEEEEKMQYQGERNNINNETEEEEEKMQYQGERNNINNNTEEEEEEKMQYQGERKNINNNTEEDEEEEEESKKEKGKEKLKKKLKEKSSYTPSDENFSNYQNIKDKTIYMPQKKDLPPAKEEKLDNDNNQKRKLNLMVMVIPKTNKDLPLPLNTLYFFLELFSYENELKQLTDEDNKLVFYLMNISWLNELKVYYNYKCIEFIIKKELKENKNFLNKINELLSVMNPTKLFEDYKLIDKFNNIIINPRRIKKKYVDNEELFAPKKIKYDIIKINKNIVSPNLDHLKNFSYYPKCMLINERMRNLLYLEYKYLKFSQFQKGDITLVDNKIFIKLTNKIIEVCSFETKNLIITPLYILYYFDISNVPFWENVLYDKKDFREEYLLKRIHRDNRHIQCLFDPYNTECIGYAINLNIKYGGEPIKEYNPLDEFGNNNGNLPDEEEVQNAVDIISKFKMDGYYDNKFKENEKKVEDDKENKFMKKMKIIRQKKQEEIMKKKKKYIETVNKFYRTNNTDNSDKSFVNVNGEIIGFVQGDDLTKNGEGYVKDSTTSDFMSKLDLNEVKVDKRNIQQNNINQNKKPINNDSDNDDGNKMDNNEEKYMNKINEEEGEEYAEQNEDDYNERIMNDYNKQKNGQDYNEYEKNYNDDYGDYNDYEGYNNYDDYNDYNEYMNNKNYKGKKKNNYYDDDYENYPERIGNNNKYNNGYNDYYQESEDKYKNSNTNTIDDKKNCGCFIF